MATTDWKSLGFKTEQEYIDNILVYYQSLGFNTEQEYIDYLSKTKTKTSKAVVDPNSVSITKELVTETKTKEKELLGTTESGVEIKIISQETTDRSAISLDTSINTETLTTIPPKTESISGVTTIGTSTVSNNVTILNEVKDVKGTVINDIKIDRDIRGYKCDPILGCISYTFTKADIETLFKTIPVDLNISEDDPKTLARTVNNEKDYYNNLTGIKSRGLSAREKLNALGIYQTLDLCLEKCYTKSTDEGFPCYGCVNDQIISVTKKWGDDDFIGKDGSFGEGNLCGEILFESQSIQMFLTPSDLQASLNPNSPCYETSVSSGDPVTDCGPSNIILEIDVSGSLNDDPDETFYGNVQLTLEEFLDYTVLGTTGSPTLNEFLDKVFPTGAKASIAYNSITGNFNGNWSLFDSYYIPYNAQTGTSEKAMVIKVIGGEITAISSLGISGDQLQEYANNYCNGVITQTYTEPTVTPNTASKSIFNPTYSGSTTGWLGGINNNYSLFQLPNTLASASFRDPSSSANPQSLTYLSAYSASGSEFSQFTVGLDVTTNVTIASASSNFIGNDGSSSTYKLEGPIVLTTSSAALDSTGSLRIEQGQALRIRDGISFDIIPGCINPNAINYDPSATIDNGSCILNVEGCTDPNSLNYNPSANVDNGSCIYGGCTDPTAYNYNPNASVDNGTCQYVTIGNFTPPKPPKKQYVKSNSSLSVPKLTKETLVTPQGLVYNGPYHLDSKYGTLSGNISLSTPINFDNNAILYLNTNNQRRYISDNVIISTNLPAAYKAPIGPENYQKCSNCIFNKNNNCIKWQANIRANFWCNSYKPQNQLIMGGDTYRDLYPGIPQYGFYTSGNEFLLANNNYYIGSYNITNNGIYQTADTSSTTLTLKPSLLQGPNFHFTKVNINVLPTTNNITPSQPSTQTTTTSPTNTSSGGTGTSYSY
mgnify:CR=1 FL=1|jgi:hypothetical protein